MRSTADLKSMCGEWRVDSWGLRIGDFLVVAKLCQSHVLWLASLVGWVRVQTMVEFCCECKDGIFVFAAVSCKLEVSESHST